MDKIYKPLSGTDIIKWIPNVNLMKYKQLKEYTSLPRLPLVLLYEIKDSFGHWVILFETPEGIEHFDSYGYKPDDEFSFIPTNFKPDNKYLLDMLSKRDDVNYNQYIFQKKGHIATCGRWVILRYLFRHLNIDQFADMIIKTASQLKVSLDNLVALAI